MTLILGASSSGKSEFAENLVTGNNKIYIATMIPFSDIAQKRIEKHKTMRKNKKFETIECYFDIENLEIPENTNILLECLGNLVANEMFNQNTKNITQKIIFGIEKLNYQCENLYIVSNDIFFDGIKYDIETEEYMKKIAEINCLLAQKSEKVYEIVCGIPILIKGE